MRMSRSRSFGVGLSVGQGSVRRVDLTDGQRRTLEQLIGTGRLADAGAPPGAAERVRSRLDDALADLQLAQPLWLSKGPPDEPAPRPRQPPASPSRAAGGC